METPINVTDSIERPNNVAGGSITAMVFHSNSLKKPTQEMTGSKEGGFSINAFLRKQSQQHTLAKNPSHKAMASVLNTLGS